MKAVTLKLKNLGSRPLKLNVLGMVGLHSGDVVKVSEMLAMELGSIYSHYFERLKVEEGKTLANGQWELISQGKSEAAAPSSEPMSEAKADKSMANKTRAKRKS